MRSDLLLIQRQALTALLLTSVTFGVQAQSSCSASNEVGATCTITCDVGQAAVCIPANGASSPECFCTGGAAQIVPSTIFSHALRTSERLTTAEVEMPTTQPLTLVDARAVVDALLSEYGPVPVTREVVEMDWVERCLPSHRAVDACTPMRVPRKVRRTVNELLTAGQLDIVESTEAVFGDPAFHNLPETPVISLARAQNCQNSGIASITQNVGVTVSRSASISVTSSVTRTSIKTLGFSFPIPNTHVTITGNISLQNGKTDSTTKMDQEGNSITRTAVATVSNMKPNTAVGIEVSAFKIGISVPFTSNIVVDANLSANEKNLKRLSDLVPREKRTFYVRGILYTNDASQANVNYFDVPFSKASCQGSATSFEPSYLPPSGARLIERES